MALYTSGKGQVLEPDFLASLAVFTLIIGMFIAPWNTIMSSQTRFSVEKEMRDDAKRTVTFLASTQGYPEGWTAETVRIPGFAERDNVLDPEKIGEFGSMNYSRQRSLLRVQNFYLALEKDGGLLDVNGTPAEYGRNYGNASTVVPVRRDVILNSSGDLKSARLVYVVWRR